jgi:hypothetical protein
MRFDFSSLCETGAAVIELYWKVRDISYAVMRVRMHELVRMRRKSPHVRGIPHVWAHDGEEVHWYPETLEGWPEVRMGETGVARKRIRP